MAPHSTLVVQQAAMLKHWNSDAFRGRRKRCASCVTAWGHTFPSVTSKTRRMFKFVSRKRKTRDEDEDESESGEPGYAEDSDGSSSEGSSVDSDDEEVDEASDGGLISASDVLQHPFIPDPTSEDVTLCLVCPGKVLKNERMVEVHESSNVCSASNHLNMHVMRDLARTIFIFRVIRGD